MVGLLAGALGGCSDVGEFAGVKEGRSGGFVPPPGDPAVVVPGGAAAILREDPVKSPISLDNPAYGVPGDASVLSFDYDLTVPAGNEDYLQVYVADAAKPTFEVGGGAGRYAGTHRVDVTRYRGQTVRVIFSLMAGWNDQGFDSTVEVKNLACER